MRKQLGKEKSQLKDVLQYLQTNGSITSMEAFNKFRITRLAACIHILRRYGYNIETEKMSGKNEYGIYNYAKYILN